VLAELRHDLRDEVRGRLAPTLEEHLPGDGEILASAVGYGRNYSSWSPIVHGVLAGMIDLDEAGRVHRTTLHPVEADLSRPRA
jgi:hypothetical protein